MKKSLLFIYFSLIFSAVFAQKVKVLDKTNLQPLVGVSIFSPSNGVVTNGQGEADLDNFLAEEVLTIQYIGYQALSFKLEDLKAKPIVYLVEKSYDLNEIVVSASKFDEKRADVPQQVQVLKAKDLAFMNQQNLADVLQQSGNVLVQKSQQGGGSPILRGFEANKVLIVVDGVRMNNAIFRGGHLQNVITMDNTILDRVEVVFGPGSVIYGSDALGGVMHFHTKKPQLASSNSEGEGGFLLQGHAFMRYATVNQEKSGHLDLNFGLKKLAFLTSFTYSDFGDLRQGNVRNPLYGDWGKRLWTVERRNGADVIVPNENPNLQKMSGYKQYDFLQKILFQQSDKISHTLNFQYSTSSDIPRYDRLNELRNGNPRSAQWYYGPQKRLLAAYNLELKGETRLYSQARVIVAFQDIEESRHDRNFNNVNLNHRTEKVKLWTINADFNKNIAEHEIRYGIEFANNQVNSSAFRENVDNGTIAVLDTRYPDGGSVMRTWAAYLTHTWEVSPKFIITEGLRYSHIYLKSNFNNESGLFPLPYNEILQQQGAFNGNLGLIYQPKGDWRFALLGSSGFRAPNVDDMGKVFEGSTRSPNPNSVNSTVVVPNPDLKPEYTYNVELNVSKVIVKKIKLEATGFYTWYRNAISLQPFTFNGQSNILYGGVQSQVIANVNADRAYLYGLNVGLSADITPEFSINSTLNYTYARIRRASGDTPLDHIPPVFGKTSFNLNLKKFRTEFFLLYNGWKRLKDYNLVGEDNIQYALPDYGSPAWTTLNLRTAYQFNQSIQFQVALENILDQNYRVFASGISGAGRNLLITLRSRF
ncbi:MAG: TonB-dependent receptor [Microscillaceae bacterium]|jgi:hemoglobin/transferrin/lactoferrin receptor protein|nr:TonB-dependent receptor [Microscillaceae bacterium]